MELKDYKVKVTKQIIMTVIGTSPEEVEQHVREWEATGALEMSLDVQVELLVEE